MIQEVRLDDIRIRLFNKDQIVVPHKIENTPHYKLLDGNRKSYDKYYQRMVDFGRAKSNYMNSEQYLDFFDRFTYLQTPYDKEYISVKKVGDIFDSIDGDHRLAALKKQNKEFVYVNVQDSNFTFKHQGFSNMINILSSLKDLDDYVIIKGHDYFPNYYDYDDLDILCKDKDNLFNVLNDRLSNKYPKFDIKTKDKGIRKHIDLYPAGFTKLNFRFDLLGKFPYDSHLNHSHNKINVKNEYFDLIFSRKVRKLIDVPVTFNCDKLYAWFPSDVDDLVLRFLEWVWQPHKTRHINDFKAKFKHEDEFIKIINEYTTIQVDKKYLDDIFNQLEGSLS